MDNKILFSYMIGDAKVDVCSLSVAERFSFVNAGIYQGLTQAVAEYLCYPYEIIAPRAWKFKVEFFYDHGKIEESVLSEDERIRECTKSAFLNYMEASQKHAELILPEYIITPNLNLENISIWCENLKEKAEKTNVHIHKNKSSTQGFEWIEFCYNDNKFYGRYYENDSKYLLVSLPGYNSEWNDMSAYVDRSYDILQLSPLGYNTPYGFNEEKKIRGAWPVLYDTVTETSETVGYNKWFLEVCLAIKGIKKPGQKLMFIGTSQGGGAALILSSIFNGCTIACAAEMPFFIGFSDFNYTRVKNFVANQINDIGKMIYDFYAKERLYIIDPMAHSQRIKCRTLLVAGELDRECLPADIYRLFEILGCKKEYIELKEQGHGYTKEFMNYAKRWINSALRSEEECD